MQGLADTLDRFLAAFNSNDLTAVMTFFAEEALYRPGDGKEHRGKAAIGRAFQPQFAGVYGQMTFLLEDRLVDEPGRKAAIRWVCRHDLRGTRGRGVPLPLRWLYRLMYGPSFGWHGTDVFHFDDAGQIVGKFTYASYNRPRIHPEPLQTSGSNAARP